MTLLSIDAPHFNAGVVVGKRYVETAAPIVKYMLGWTPAQVYEYCDKKGWKIVEVEC